MSRMLTAASMRLFRGLSSKQPFLNTSRYLTTKKPTAKSTTAPKCQKDEKEKPPPPGTFPSGGTHAVFSDLPKPEGDFMKEWSAKNSKYNMILISGIVALVGSIALGISSGVMELYCFVPEYPYTKEELEEFEKEEVRKQEEIDAREERHKDLVEAKELTIRRRKARDAMKQEVAFMQKDIDEGLSDGELAQLQDLVQKREEFEKWEAEEEKRLKEQAKEREKLKKEKEKAEKEKQKEKEKEKKEKEKEAKKKAN
ncbi:cancer-related regulator of actin dynamics homolog [Scaptodrosophila lebanonensis]|uniref:Cancer-related regulator of actin dynamics homolog n=1 Tax=Drosophila lebanonensis TaxID=7225 RepID=A0A6J2TIG3_DROLE|nr:cancer-related regulator of actin dynamics homolog [Scaptodrosophila lebanonensis]XP_030375236.1 cancer-related regulator of actin dynamics homolog [Scaptodrosophila lebanonensis]